jgi:hypothetical protein
VDDPAPDSAPAPGGAPASAPEPGIDTTPGGFTRVRDDAAGVSIAYPRTWSRLRPPAGGPDLVAARGRAMSLLMRASPTGLPADLEVTAATLPIVRQLTDRLVRADRRVRLLEPPEAIELGGLPGYRYRYTFADAGGRRGAHVHYFLFKAGGRMITLVLQALPAERLAGLTPLFESVAGTFRGRPG